MTTAEAARNRQLYVQWLAATHPQIYSRIRATLLSGLGWVQIFAAVANAVAQAGSLALQKKQADAQLKLQKTQMQAEIEAAKQQAQLQANTQRAQAGLAPLDASGRVITSASQINSYLPYLLIGGVGLVGVVVLMKR